MAGSACSGCGVAIQRTSRRLSREHPTDVVERSRTEASCEGLSTVEVDVTDGDEFRFGQAGEGLGVSLADLAAAHQSRPQLVHPC